MKEEKTVFSPEKHYFFSSKKDPKKLPLLKKEKALLFFEKPNNTKSINNISWMGKLIKPARILPQTKGPFVME